LINDRLLTRKSDGSQYRKVPARPSDEARSLMAAWRARQAAASRTARHAAGTAQAMR